MKTSWKYQHLIDLEYFFEQDKNTGEDDLLQRDRRIFLDGGEDMADSSSGERLFRWLQYRLHDEFADEPAKSPGKLFSSLLRLSRQISLLKGLLVGGAAGLAFFSYQGETPVNVFHFLVLFVGLQLALVMLLPLVGLFRKVKQHVASGNQDDGAMLLTLLTSLTSSSFHWLYRRALQRYPDRFTAAQRNAALAAAGRLRAYGKRYGSVVIYPFFSVVQIFMIGTNLGLLATTLLKVTTSDLAFGWQSTLQLSNSAVHGFTRLAALPWSWLLPQAQPSFEAVAGSRIILKDGIYFLSTVDLRAWWPFLLLCLITYGLVPRLLLLGGSLLVARRKLGRLRFDSAPCRAVLRRMQTPVLSTKGIVEPVPEQPAVQEAIAPSEKPAAQEPQILGLMPIDVADDCDKNWLATQLDRHNLGVSSWQTFMEDYDSDRNILKKLADSLREQQQDQQQERGVEILLVMESWMVPLVASLSFIRELRALLDAGSTPAKGSEPGEHRLIYLAMLGRPTRGAQGNGARFLPPAESDLAIWQHKLQSLADPYIQLLPIIDQELS